MRRQDDLSIAAGQAEPGSPDLVAAPQKLMAQRIAIEAQACVQIGDGNRDGIDFWISGAVRIPPSLAQKFSPMKPGSTEWRLSRQVRRLLHPQFQPAGN